MATEAAIDVLKRWEDHGAVWRAVHVSDAKAVVDLCTCDGQPVERLQSDDAELIAFLRERAASER
jgi:hypothetical protein